MSRKLVQICLVMGTLFLLPVLLSAQGRTPNKKDMRVWTNLMQAAAHLNDHGVREELKAGANPNQTNEQGVTPLMLGARWVQYDVFFGQPELSARIMKLLCDAGAAPNTQNLEGQTALMYAAQMGNEKAIQNLLDAKANVHIQDKRGRTALTYAAHSYPEASAILIAKGSKPSLIDLILLKKRTEVTERLKTIHTVRGVGIYDETALYLAAENDWADVAKRLIECGVNVNTPDERGQTPLMVAIGGNIGHQQMGGLYYPKKQDRMKSHALMSERIELVKLLIQHGANVNAKMKEWNLAHSPYLYALTMARETLSDQITEILKQAGAVEYDKKSPSRKKKAK